MNYKIFFTQESLQDLRNITEYIAKDNPEGGRVFVTDLMEAVKNNLSTFPK